MSDNDEPTLDEHGRCKCCVCVEYRRRSELAAPTGSALPGGMSREAAVDSLRELRNLATAAEARANPGFVRWPDLDALIDHIAERGLPPNAERSDRNET